MANRCRVSGPVTSPWLGGCTEVSSAARYESPVGHRRSPGQVVGLRRWDGNAKREYCSY